MKNPAPSSDAALQDILVWSAFAHAALSSSLHALQPSDVRARKHSLLRQHARHVAQLQGWIRRPNADRAAGTKRPAAWDQVIHAMASCNEYVALAACGLLERAVLAAYQRSAGCRELDPAARRLVRRHMRTLEGSRERVLQRRPSWFERAKRSAAALTGSTDFEGMVATAS